MGYTHYFPQTQECPLDQWATFKVAVMRCFEMRPDVPISAGSAHATGLPFNICDGSARSCSPRPSNCSSTAPRTRAKS